MPPRIESFGSSRNRLVNILFSRTRKPPNDVARVRRIPILKPLVAAARRPAAVDEIMVCLDALCGSGRTRPFFDSFFCLGHMDKRSEGRDQSPSPFSTLSRYQRQEERVSC